MQSLTGSEINDEEMMKYHAKDAADTIVRAEQHKKDKKLMKHVKKELKERKGHIDAAIGGSAKDKDKGRPNPKARAVGNPKTMKKAPAANKSASKKK